MFSNFGFHSQVASISMYSLALFDCRLRVEYRQRVWRSWACNASNNNAICLLESYDGISSTFTSSQKTIPLNAWSNRSWFADEEWIENHRKFRYKISQLRKELDAGDETMLCALVKHFFKYLIADCLGRVTCEPGKVWRKNRRRFCCENDYRSFE